MRACCVRSATILEKEVVNCVLFFSVRLHCWCVRDIHGCEQCVSKHRLDGDSLPLQFESKLKVLVRSFGRCRRRLVVWTKTTLPTVLHTPCPQGGKHTTGYVAFTWWNLATPWPSTITVVPKSIKSTRFTESYRLVARKRCIDWKHWWGYENASICAYAMTFNRFNIVDSSTFTLVVHGFDEDGMRTDGFKLISRNVWSVRNPWFLEIYLDCLHTCSTSSWQTVNYFFCFVVFHSLDSRCLFLFGILGVHGSRIGGERTNTDNKGFARNKLHMCRIPWSISRKQRGHLDIWAVNVDQVANTPFPRNFLASTSIMGVSDDLKCVLRSQIVETLR